MNLLYIGTGGFIGAILRYSISKFINQKFPFSSIPYGTLLVNIIGAFILAYLMSLSIHKIEFSKEFILFFGTGMLGAFTTFSTFMYESISMIENNNLLFSAIYVSVSIIAGIFSSYFGYILGRS
ncbi:putative fluoride ion transporter CrcB [Tepiditoga spiralis]|uniref:Fluoride-specific ion channel FluC n=1 Tax=Tepiditoga spiralis TaxID=2108365 RepID=A0A7G1GBZ4_9BACT|nr:fluoride efflux transporter CrcB [Tepiditoga spiralis]BBE31519.1 putative fluoride ion transporter CrcB [Tepiditoga spiralis]